MHLVIPHATPSGPQCQAALERLELPHLRHVLRALTLKGELRGSESDLSPIAERVQTDDAYADGLIPWAAMAAEQLQGTPGDAAWGLVTPCHWVVHADHVAMHDPRSLRLEATESQALLAAMAPYFLEDGLTLHYWQADTWLVRGEVLRNLPTASLNRVRGQSVDAWLPRTAAARVVRRLQNEMQMLLYTHAINDARTARGVPVVNSFWLSGTGDASAKPPAVDGITVHDGLRAPALNDDAHAWTQAWQTLDSGPVAEFARLLQQRPGTQPALTLCSETVARTWRRHPQSLLHRMKTALRSPSPLTLLKSL
ncbi:MAG: phosphoglycerate mutase [Rhodoferax sp.]